MNNAQVQKIWEDLYTEKRSMLERQECTNISVISSAAKFDVALQALSRQYSKKGVPRLIQKLNPSLDHIRSFAKAISACTQANTVSTLVWGGTIAVIETSCRFSETLETMIDMMFDFNSSLPLLDSYLALFPERPQLQWPLQEMYSQYLDYCIASVKHLQRSPISNLLRFTWSSSQQKIFSNAKKGMQKHKDDFLKQVQLLHRQRDHEQNLQQILATRALAAQVENTGTSSNSFLNVGSTGLIFPITTLMDIPSRAFVGRDDILAQMQKRFNACPDTSSSEAVCVALHGMGGIGKTSIARRYCEMWKMEYDAIFWLRAESDLELADSYCLIAMKLGFSVVDRSRAIEMARDWLERTDKRWLVVFDNTETLNDLRPYWPGNAKSRSSIIITTQRPGFSAVTGFLEIPVGSLDADAGSRLLFTFLRRSPTDEAERKFSAQVIEEVGGLPLAIVIIGGYILQSEWSIKEFLDTFNGNDRFWHSSGGDAAAPYTKTLARVFEMALGELSVEALAVIRILAFLNPDEIPEDILHHNHAESPTDKRESLGHDEIGIWISFSIALLAISLNILDKIIPQLFPEYSISSTPWWFLLFTITCMVLTYAMFSKRYRRSRGVSAIWEFLDSRIAVKPPEFALQSISHESYMGVIAELRNRQLISRGTGHNGRHFLSLHRSLQWSILHTLNKDQETRQRVFQEAFHLVRQLLPRAPSYETTVPPIEVPLFKMMAPQVMSLGVHSRNPQPPLNQTVEFAFLLTDLSTYLWHRGMVKDTISVMESAEDILDKISYDQNSKIRSDIDMCLGRQVELRGIEGREIGLLRKQRGVSIRQKMLDEAIEHNKEDEIRLWNAKADLAVSYLQDERFDDAGAIMEQAVLQYHKWGTEAEFPFEHAKWFNHYAFVRLWQRRPDEAIEMARHGVELQTIACGVDGSLTLMKRFFMAHMLYIAGRMDEALEVNKMVLEDQIRALGEASFYTLQSMAFYGMLLYEVKYLDEAEKQLRTCLRLANKADWYPAHIARVQFYLSCTIRQKNLVKEEKELIKEADDLEATSFLFRDKMLQLFPQLLKDDPAGKGSVFDQIVPFLCGRMSGKLVDRYKA